MKIKIIITLSIAAFATLFSACGGAATNTSVNIAAANKPANTPAPASTPAPSNTNTEKSDTASNPELDFTLVNKTGYDIKEVSVGPAGDAEWTKDDEVLKGGTFKDGASLDIKFHPKAKAENWDIKIEWTDGSPSVEWLKMNLTKIEKVTLKYDRATDKTTAVIE